MANDHRQIAKDFWGKTSVELLSKNSVEDIFQRLSELHVELDPDPLELGPKRLQNKIYACRNALSACEKIFLSISQKLYAAKRDYRAKEKAFELSKKYLFATDPEVRSGSNVSDREAMAAVKLKDEWMAVCTAEQLQEDLDAVMIVIKAKRADLKDTQSRLRDQWKLCQTEIELGGRWGSKVRGASEIEAGEKKFAFSGMTEIDRLIKEFVHIDSDDDPFSGIGIPDEGLESLVGEITESDSFLEGDEDQDQYLDHLPDPDTKVESTEIEENILDFL